MTERVFSIAAKRPTGRYYRVMRYLYDLRGYVSPRELCKLLFGVSLIAAAPFFYLLITYDVMACVVFMTNAAAGGVIGIRNFVGAHDGGPQLVPFDDVPPMPSVARRGLRAA